MPVILHADLNNCYASIECLYQPALRGKPVAVCGDVEKRQGIVLAKNDLARRQGVETGSPIWMAKQRCPELVTVEPHYDRYLAYAQMTREIYSEYTQQVEPFGLDEAWLDVGGSGFPYGFGRRIADEIRSRILFELGVTASVGVSFNRVFAKLGSDLKKPDATTVITQQNFRETVWPLPAGDLLYVGPATRRKLAAYGIRTIGELAQADPAFLQARLGKVGLMLRSFANGQDRSPVQKAGFSFPIQSVGNSTTAPRDLAEEGEVKIVLYNLCEAVAARLREYGFRCCAVQITLRDNRLLSLERQCALPQPTCTAKGLFQAAFSLYRAHKPPQPLRSLGVRGLRLLGQGDGMQLSLYESARRQQKEEWLEEAMDRVRNRFGYTSVRRGLLLCDPKLSALDAKSEHVIHPVPFFNQT